jgi:hypothetical protein
MIPLIGTGTHYGFRSLIPWHHTVFQFWCTTHMRHFWAVAANAIVNANRDVKNDRLLGFVLLLFG